MSIVNNNMIHTEDPPILSDFVIDTEEKLDNMLSSQMSIINPAVVVRNAHKAYLPNVPIIDGLDMTVPKGEIYSLLGASGCGKTTMLSCIVGLKKLDKGTISVFGKSPKPGESIGYMPQDTGLQEIFNIKEILSYYGKIFGMTMTQVKARTEFLIEFLDLKSAAESHRLINTCSGGQKRRISLACSLIHSPSLLILDEPTVGVDPTLRESIWKHLQEICQVHKTTIIITTHYIEEARQSNIVGICRGGKLLVEQPPQLLLHAYQTEYLEEVFLKLCENDERENTSHCSSDPNLAQMVVAHKSSKFTQDGFNDELDCKIKGIRYTAATDDGLPVITQKESKINNFVAPNRQEYSALCIRKRITHKVSRHFDKTLAVLIKNLLTLMRSPWFFWPLLLIPAAQVFLWNLVLGRSPSHVPLGVINNELINIPNMLDYCDHHKAGCFVNDTSCQFINMFHKNDITFVMHTSIIEAISSIERGETIGYISIPNNFSFHIQQRSLLRNFIENDTLDATTISSRLDSSFVLKSEFIKDKIRRALLGFFQELAELCGSNPKEVDLPMKFGAIYGKVDDPTFLTFLQPGNLVLIILLLPLASALHFIIDRKLGTLERGLVAGLDYSHILIAHTISEGFLIILEIAVCLGVMSFFGVHIEGSPLLFLTILFLEGMIGLGLGFLFGSLCNHELEATICMLGVYLPILSSSGTIWPVESIPYAVRILSRLNPSTRTIESLRSIMGRGWGITHPAVYPAILNSLVWIAFCFTASIIIQRMRR